MAGFLNVYSLLGEATSDSETKQMKDEYTLRVEQSIKGTSQ